MRKGDLYLVRGLPGSGKSTVAERIACPDGAHLSADSFFEAGGAYRFDPARLGEAHEWCLNTTGMLLRRMPVVAVANTFTRAWEWKKYLTLPFRRLHVLDLFDAGLTNEELHVRCTHGVPLHTIARMRGRYERG